MRKLAAELVLLDSGVRSISQKHYHSSNEVSPPPFVARQFRIGDVVLALHNIYQPLTRPDSSRILKTSESRSHCNGLWTSCNGLTYVSATISTNPHHAAPTKARLNLARRP